MKNIFLTLLFLNSFLCHADVFYIYHHGQPPAVLNATSVYTKAEIKSLNKLGVDSNVAKFRSELDLAALKKAHPTFKFERVQNIQLHSYTSYQWYLNNKGGDIIRRITDIDTQTIQAISGEDINIPSNDNQALQKIKVAVIDSGLDLNHPEFKGVFRKVESECQALADYKTCLSDSSRDNDQCHEQLASIDTDNNGYPLDCNGWSMTNQAYPGIELTGNPEIKDNIGHGTHVTGIIAAKSDGVGTDGIASNVEIIPVQVALNSASESPIDNIAKGVLYSLQNGAQIINLSLGWKFQFDSKLMRDMVKAAHQRGVAIVVAAGNDSHNDISYPCAYEGTICVGAHDQTGKLAYYSNNGSSVDVIAPGTDILSTWPTTKRSKAFTQDYNYEFMSGTSQAAPIVTGLMAKLMGHGLSATQARIKLLKGAREKVQKVDIRFGNVDYLKALATNERNFLYPLNKEPSIIAYKKESQNQIKIKIKNYGATREKISLSLSSLSSTVRVVNPTRGKLNFASNETKEFIFELSIDDYSESELRFELNLEQEKFIVRGNIIRFIHPQIEDPEIIVSELTKTLDASTILRAFEDYTDDNTTDFLAVTTTQSRTSLTILKEVAGNYEMSKVLAIRDINPIFLNYSKVDLDLDNKADYVVTYVTVDRQGDKTSKFLIFDHELKPKRILIAPDNKFDNKKTFLPGKFKWLRQGERMVPAWIGFGENGSELASSPWETSRPTTGQYLYYLSAELGLQHYTLPEKENPLHILYQSEQQLSEGSFFLITGKGSGFFKEYSLYRAYNDVTKISSIAMNDYFDLFEPRPLPLLGSQFPNGFFNEQSNGGSQFIFTMEVKNRIVASNFMRLENPFKDENIKFVKSVSKDYIFYQTDHKIAVLNRNDGQTAFRQSKVNTRQRRYTPLKNRDALYLPAKDAPGFTSEILSVNSTNSLASLGQYRILAIQGCEDMGLTSKLEKQFIVFACLEAGRILFLPIE